MGIALQRKLYRTQLDTTNCPSKQFLTHNGLCPTSLSCNSTWSSSFTVSYVKDLGFGRYSAGSLKMLSSASLSSDMAQNSHWLRHCFMQIQTSSNIVNIIGFFVSIDVVICFSSHVYPRLRAAQWVNKFRLKQLETVPKGE